MSFFILAGLIIFIDQLSKFYIQHNLEIGESIPLIKGILHITYIENPHTAFGLFKYQTIFFVMASLISLLLVILIYKKLIFKNNSFMYVPLNLILGGAIGNLIDRIRVEGRVIDFIDIRIWPIFNFADMSIVCGMLVILIYTLFFAPSETTEVTIEEEEKEEKLEEKEDQNSISRERD